jgi:hypothetical protein
VAGEEPWVWYSNMEKAKNLVTVSGRGFPSYFVRVMGTCAVDRIAGKITETTVLEIIVQLWTRAFPGPRVCGGWEGLS